ncbi:MAG: hypothetical protein H0W88_05485 [Parachlamydiaceae bacterium]|nr:hypothetical protein [Parachlamydiaceae bacterium]
MSIIDTETMEKIADVEYPSEGIFLATAHSLAITPDGQSVYVNMLIADDSVYFSQRIVVVEISTKSNQIVDKIEVSKHAADLQTGDIIITPDNLAYVAYKNKNSTTKKTEGRISVINTLDNKIVHQDTPIVIGDFIYRLCACETTEGEKIFIGSYDYRTSNLTIIKTADIFNKETYIKKTVGFAEPFFVANPKQETHPRIYVCDNRFHFIKTVSNEVVGMPNIEPKAHHRNIAVSHDGKKLYVTNHHDINISTGKTVSVFDVSNKNDIIFIESFQVGDLPFGIAIGPQAKVLKRKR